jgi:hypothetical protein
LEGCKEGEEFCFWWGGEEGEKAEFLIRRAIDGPWGV